MKLRIVELMYEHAAKHAGKAVAVNVTPAMKGLATAIETDLQRCVDDLCGEIKKLKDRISELENDHA